MSNQQIRVTLTGDSTGLEGAGRRASRTLDDLVRSSGNSQRTLTQLNGVTAQSARQMALLAPQVTDVVTSLAGGMNPMLVLIQQGGQLRDVFGGIRPALAAVASLFTAKTIIVGGLAASVGILTKAYLDGTAQTERYRDMQALTGGAIGITRDQFERLIETSARASQATVQDARAIAEALGSTGRVGGAALGTLTAAALRYQAVSGKTSQEVSAMFADMAKDAYAWASRNNEAMNFATSGQLENIRAMRDAGDQQGALIATGELLIAHLRNQGDNLGWLERMIRGTSSAWSSFKDALTSIGRPDTTADVLGGLRQQLREVQASMRGMSPTWDGAALTGARRQEAALLQRIADIEANERDGRVRAGNRAVAAREEQERTARLNKLREATERLSGANSQYIKDLEAIAAAGRAGDITPAEQTRLLTELALRNAPPAPPKPRAPASTGDSEAAYQRMVRETIANRAPRLADMNAADYESIAKWERDQMIAQARASQQAAADAERNRERAVDQAARMGEQLADQAASINADLIVDDTRRAEAQLEIERQAIQRRIAMLAAAGADVRGLEDDLAAYMVARRAEATEALKPQWQKMLEGWRDTNRLMQDSWDGFNTQFIQGSEQTWIEMMRTGKLSAGKLVDLVLVEFARLQFRQQIAPLLGNLLGSLGSALGIPGLSGSAAAGSSGVNYSLSGSALGGSGSGLVIPNARGNAYSGLPSLSAYSGKVVSRPTFFAFARGAGVMGEAGDEGIFPLKRNSRGQLGVIASGGSGSGAAPSVVNNVIIKDAPPGTTQSSRRNNTGGLDIEVQIARVAVNAVAADAAAGGVASRTLAATFGLQRQAPQRN
jgi:lambda family phage tail tape measure protein